MSASAALLPDGRLHLQHGPIDLLCRAWGAAEEVGAAYRQAVAAFREVLPGLCAELPLLRAAMPAPLPDGPIARAMHRACLPFENPFPLAGEGRVRAGPGRTLTPTLSRGRERETEEREFITPMAAVAGAVADHVLAALCAGRRLERGFVNNGGDIAFHLAPGQALRCGLVCELAAPGLDGIAVLRAADPARGIATSGRACKGQGGRSFSFGIADAVTVLADTAAQADAAATVIGNAVDLPGHPAVRRRPACDVDPDSDLGARLVTWAVSPLAAAEVDAALAAGRGVAEALLARGLIRGAVLALRGRMVPCETATLLSAA